MPYLSSFEFVVFLFLVIYALSSIFIIIESRKRRIGVLRSVLICLFLTPVTGYLFVSKSKMKNPPAVIFYECPRCGHRYNHKHKYCPGCESNGRYIKLRTVS